MEKSLWDQSVRQWIASTGLWACCALAIVVTAHGKFDKHAHPAVSAASAPIGLPSQPVLQSAVATAPIAKVHQAKLQPVTFKVRALNLSDYTDAAYADATR